MSNVIKAYTVCYDKSVTKTIDSHQNWKEIEKAKEKLIKQSVLIKNEPKENTDGFVSGLEAVPVKELPLEEELSEKSSQIIENAKLEAQQILEQAKQEALRVQKEAYEEAKNKGYNDGIAAAELEIKEKTAEIDQIKVELQKDYENMVADLEPQIAEIIASLVEKVVGAAVEDGKEVILYLVKKALRKQDKCNDFTLRISKEDYEFVNNKKDVILASLGRDVTLRITEDPSLNKNQCLIETDLSVINCGLDEQLNNLIMDIKLLGGVI